MERKEVEVAVHAELAVGRVRDPTSRLDHETGDEFIVVGFDGIWDCMSNQVPPHPEISRAKGRVRDPAPRLPTRACS